MRLDKGLWPWVRKGLVVRIDIGLYGNEIGP